MVHSLPRLVSSLLTRQRSHDSSCLGTQAAQPDDARSVTRNLRNLPVAAPIRSKYLYCNMMYTVATHLVEVKSQQRFSEFLQQHFFNPLGMASTSLQPSSARAAGHGDRMATGHSWDKNSSAYREFPGPDCPEGQGAGSIIASANDFIKFVKALMNHEEPINERVYHGLVRMRSFPNPSARRLKPHTSPVVYASGLEVYYYRGYMVAGHDGSIAGFSSRFLFLPGVKFGAVILANSSSAIPLITILMREMIDEVLKIPEAERASRGNKTKPAPGPVATDIAVRSKKTAKETEDKQENEKRQAPKPKKKKRPTTESNSPPQQETPLTSYVGTYWHPGYRNLTVQIREDKLFIDATDRSMGFNIVFEHVDAQTKYTAHLIDVYDEEDEQLAAEFLFKDDKAVKMGLHIEPVLKDMIWFERVEGELS